MALVKTINTPSGKRPLGWVVATPTYGNVLVVKRTPRAIAVTTKKAQYVSINDSADNDQAGWTLDDVLIRALKTYDCQKVVVYVPKPGLTYMTDAQNYLKGGVMYLAANTKTGPRLRCVATRHFERRAFRVKL